MCRHQIFPADLADRVSQRGAKLLLKKWRNIVSFMTKMKLTKDFVQCFTSTATASGINPDETKFDPRESQLILILRERLTDG